MSHTASAKHNTLAHSQMMSKMKAKTLIPTVLVLFIICVSTLWMFVSSTRRLEDSPAIKKRLSDTGGDRLRSIPLTDPPGETSRRILNSGIIYQFFLISNRK